MPDSPVFDHACGELERRTSLDRLSARGTVRIAVRSAGLDVSSIDVPQMQVLLRKVLPGELESRGVPEGRTVCEEIARALDGMRFDVARDRAGAAAETLARFGS